MLIIVPYLCLSLFALSTVMVMLHFGWQSPEGLGSNGLAAMRAIMMFVIVMLAVVVIVAI